MSKVPYGVTLGDPDSLGYFSCEISYAGAWVNLNDGHRYKIDGENTRDSTAKSWRTVKASSPILGGDYLIHAVPEMVLETIGVWVYGSGAVEVNDHYWHLMELFEQLDYRIRWTFDNYREYWRCQLAESSSARGQVWSHNHMAKVQFQVPRYPQVTRERVD